MNLHVKEASERVYETAGFTHLSMREILYLLIGRNSKNTTIDKVVDRLLQDHKEYGMKNLSVEELETIPGIGRRTAEQICAAVELGKRAFEVKKDKYQIKSPEDAYDLLEDIKHENQENFVAIYLDTKNNVISKKTLFIGTLNSSVVHPRDLFREAVKLSAASVIVGHNHPSLDSRPSQEDLHVTRRLVESGKMVGIEVLDHVIIGEFPTSLKEKGHL